MRTRVQKWGNSLAVRIPKPFAEDAGWEAATEVEMSMERGTLRLSPVRRRWALKTLVAGVTARNRHAEVDHGGPMGRESW